MPQISSVIQPGSGTVVVIPSRVLSVEYVNPPVLSAELISLAKAAAVADTAESSLDPPIGLGIITSV